MHTIVRLVAGMIAAGALISAPAQADQMSPKEISAARNIYQSHGCSSCHAASESLAGPTLQAIAKRYRGKPVSEELVRRVREGSSGRYGDLPHPPQALAPEDAERVTRWILAGAPGL